VTGICDNEDLSAKFRSLVEPINSDNNLDGIVMSYRLFPNNVACLNEPSMLVTPFKGEGKPQGEDQWSAESSWGLDASNSASPLVSQLLWVEFCVSYDSR
jgi:hypothetical protein